MQHLDEGTLQSWLDGERAGMSSAEREAVEAHLAVCDACRRTLASLDAVSARTAALLVEPSGAAPEPPDFQDVVKRSRGYHVARRRRSAWSAAAWAASVILALGVGWGANEVYQGRQAAPRAAAEPPARPPAAEPAAQGPEARKEQVAAAPAPATEAPRPSAMASRTADAGVRAADGTPAEDTAKATAPAVIEGRVTDEAGRPLASAQVLVEGTGRGGLTAPDGTFSIPVNDLPADTAVHPLTVVAQLIGYDADRRVLEMRRGGVASADFRLDQRSLALDEVVVTGAAAARNVTASPSEIVLSPGAEPGTWTEVSRAQAEQRAGFPLLTVPGLPLLRVEIQETGGVPLVRVVQAMQDGTVIDLVEAMEALHFAADAPDDGRARVSVRRNGLSVAASAPLSAEALRALVDRLR